MTDSTPQGATASTNRPARLRRSTRLGALVLAVVMLVAACNQFETRMTELVDGARANAGAQPLTHNQALYNKAMAWAQKMAADGKLSHSRLADDNPYAWKSLGENVAYGCNSSIDAIHNALMESSSHRANILNYSYNYWAVAVYEQGNCLWVVQEFMQL